MEESGNQAAPVSLISLSDMTGYNKSSDMCCQVVVKALNFSLAFGNTFLASIYLILKSVNIDDG